MEDNAGISRDQDYPAEWYIYLSGEEISGGFDGLKRRYRGSQEMMISFFLIHLQDGNKTVRARASDALAQIGSLAMAPLSALLQHPSWVLRYRAAEALGGVKDPGAVSSLLPLLDDEKDHVRYMAAKSLGRYALQIDIPAERLTPLLSDDNPYVRRMAAITLGLTEGQEVNDILKEAGRREQDPEVRAAIATAIKPADEE